MIGGLLMSPTEVALDVRDLAPRYRHERIFAGLALLPVGGVLQLTNDHDPLPLWYQLQTEESGQFTWTYRERGPSCWRVRIERLAPPPEHQEEPPRDRAPAPSIYLDNRGLEPPEPLVRILEALARLETSQELVADLDREPLLLYPQLVNRGFSYKTEARVDGDYRVRIRRGG